MLSSGGGAFIFSRRFAMVKAFFMAVGLFILILGLQLLCIDQVDITYYDVFTEKVIEKNGMRVADFLPYSLVCVGLVVLIYSKQMQNQEG
jgi:uncharacterized membrane protein YczE